MSPPNPWPAARYLLRRALTDPTKLPLCAHKGQAGFGGSVPPCRGALTPPPTIGTAPAAQGTQRCPPQAAPGAQAGCKAAFLGKTHLEKQCSVLKKMMPRVHPDSCTLPHSSTPGCAQPGHGAGRAGLRGWHRAQEVPRGFLGPQGQDTVHPHELKQHQGQSLSPCLSPCPQHPTKSSCVLQPRLCLPLSTTQPLCFCPKLSTSTHGEPSGGCSPGLQTSPLPSTAPKRTIPARGIPRDAQDPPWVLC